MRGLEAQMAVIQARHDEVAGKIEEGWEEVASAKAKAPDGMPSGSGFSDRYPEIMDRLDKLKAERKAWLEKAYPLFRQIMKEREFLAGVFRQSIEQTLLTMYFIHLKAYRQIAREKDISEATIRRRIARAVNELDIPEEKEK